MHPLARRACRFDPWRVHQPNQWEDASAQALRRSLFERIQDGQVEVREISQKLAAQEKEMIEAVLRESRGRVSGPSGRQSWGFIYQP
jgi:hypothetical protein